MFDSLQPASYGVATVFFVVSTITILLRIYSRGFIVKSIGWDDRCMFAILFFNCGQQAMLYYFLHNGGGLHMDVVLAINPDWLVNLTYALFAEEIYYIWMHWIIKMAFLLFYLRIGAAKAFRTLVYATMGLNTLLSVIIWLIYCFQCIPLDAYFNKAAHPTVKCLDNSILYFVPAAFSILTDCLILILPLRTLWRIEASLRKRIMLISIVSLGGVAVLISMLRLIVLREFQTSTDFTYTLGKMIIISAIEIEVAIIAANGPSLKTFWVKHVSKTAYTGRDQYGRTHELSNMSCGSGQRKQKILPESSHHANGNYSPEQLVQGRGKLTREEWHNDSREKLFKNESGIIVTSSVGIETHAAQNSPEFVRTYNQFDRV